MDSSRPGCQGLPWYDSPWLDTFLAARNFVERHCPEKIDDFLSKLEVLRTQRDFRVRKLSQVFASDALQEIQHRVRSILPDQLEQKEFFQFGRHVVHDDPYFCKLHQNLVDDVSRWVGEPVEPSYNFLSLYNNFGICPVHMDAPKAKWTLDLCIDQSGPWPIHISNIRPWPEDFDVASGDWQASILDDPDNHFVPYVLDPGEALIFSGSSQWHYRDRIINAVSENFCHLAFFHFRPRGAGQLLEPRNWPRLFDIPELEPIVTAVRT